MKLTFYKYHGTGNDFILIDDWNGTISKKLSAKIIRGICHRRFGIGADGFILLKKHKDYDFEMEYFNSNGKRSSMCGNGARCIVAFAKFLKRIKSKTNFLAVDGPHKGVVSKDVVSIQMTNVKDITKYRKDWLLNTGSPHYIQFVNDLDSIDTAAKGAKIRYSKTFFKKGVNVNFVQAISRSSIKMSTYERGVEDETYSCGTGVVAASLAYHHASNLNGSKMKVRTKGGRLEVTFKSSEKGYTDIWLHGPAVKIAEGIIDIRLF